MLEEKWNLCNNITRTLSKKIKREILKIHVRKFKVSLDMVDCISPKLTKNYFQPCMPFQILSLLCQKSPLWLPWLTEYTGSHAGTMLRLDWRRLCTFYLSLYWRLCPYKCPYKKSSHSKAVVLNWFSKETKRDAEGAPVVPAPSYCSLLVQAPLVQG